MWTKDQTCPGPRLCNSYDQCVADREKLEVHEWVKKWCESGPDRSNWGLQPDGFYWCTNCRRIRRPQLVECPSCHSYFKGPKPNFRLDYECENCE